MKKVLVLIATLFLGSIVAQTFLVHGLEDPKIPLCPSKISWKEKDLFLNVTFSKEVLSARTLSPVPLEVKFSGKRVQIFLPPSSLRKYLSSSFSLPCSVLLPFTLEASLSGGEEVRVHLAFEVSLSPPLVQGRIVENPNPVPLKIFTREGMFQIPAKGKEEISGKPISFEILGKSFFFRGDLR